MQRVWFRGHDGCWYVTIREQGKQHQIKLLKASNTKEGKRRAEQKFMEEIAARSFQPDPVIKSQPWLTVAQVIQGFLCHSAADHDAITSSWYRQRLLPFADMFGDLRIAQLKKQHVMAWVTKRGFNETTQAKSIGALKRAFNWAVEEEYIPANPIAHVRKPRPKVRDRILEPEERELILNSIKDKAFRDYVRAMTLTGCRPGEVACLQPENVNLEHGLWIFRKHKTVKRTGKPRIIYLCPEALELTQEMLALHPTEYLFLNSRGEPRTRNAVRIRFSRLRKKFPQLKGIVAYTYRASFATDALERGVPDATVSVLLGHTNTDTLHRFYNRLSKRIKYLKDAAGKAAGGDVPPGTPSETPGGQPLQ